MLNRYKSLLLEGYRNKQFKRDYNGVFDFYSRQWDDIVNEQNIKSPLKSESDWVERWRRFWPDINVNEYRLFAKYCGEDLNIIPEHIGRVFLESVLNPLKYRSFYSDKNTYRMFVPSQNLPKTLAYRVDGGSLVDGFGNAMDKLDIADDFEQLILKPSVGTNSGVGVIGLERRGRDWFTTDGRQVNMVFLKNYGKNWILQESVIQHPELSKLCSSSVNTIRIVTYKSFVDERVHVLNSILRIGKNGSTVDNVHAGGRYVAIDPITGRLSQSLMDSRGNSINELNGIDFRGEYHVPRWNEVKDFVSMIALQNLHNRLLAFDIAVDRNNNPILIEYNVCSFGYWLFEFTGNTPFGEFTNEIFDHCLGKKDEIINCLKLQRSFFSLL